MPIHTHIDINNYTIIRMASGVINSIDIIHAADRTLEMQEFRKEMHVIWNIYEAEVGHLTSTDMLDVIKHIHTSKKARGCHYKIAIAANRDVNFGIARMFALYCSELPVSVSVFRNMHLAEKWINTNG